MNAQLKKEVRSLAPAFLVPVLAIATLAFFFNGQDGYGIGFLVFIGLCSLLGASSFGNEFDARTMLLLLSQPVSRRQLWFEKMRILAVALILTYGIAFFCLVRSMPPEARLESSASFAAAMLLTVLVAFAAAPFLSLVFKNLVGAAAFSVLFPMALAGAFIFLCWAAAQFTSHPDVPFLNAQFENHPYWSIGIPAVIYCVLFYWFGYRTFLNFEAVDAQSQELKLPAVVEGTLGRWVGRFLPGYTGPYASLIRKELRIHRISYLIASMLCVLLIGEGLLVKVHNSPANTVMISLEFVLLVFCVPVLVGVASLAEERSWGTLPGQLTLPLSPFKQWRLKMLVTYATAILLGVILPAVLFLLGKRLVAAASAQDAPSMQLNYLGMTYALFALGYLTVFTMIVFASSVSANSLRAILFAVGLIIGATALIALTAFSVEHLFTYAPAKRFIASLMLVSAKAAGLPISPFLELVVHLFVGLWLILLLAAAAFMVWQNFRNGELNSRRTRLHLFIIFLLVLCPSVVIMVFTRALSALNSVGV